MGSTDTFAGWPRLVAPEEVPAPFRAEGARLRDVEAATLVYNPEHRFDRYRSSAKLVAWWSDRLTILDADAGGAPQGELALDAIGRVEWGTALLTTWLEVEGGGPAGRQVLRVDFNSTCRDLYEPLLALLRRRRYAAAAPVSALPARLESLTRADYRFASFARAALHHGAAPLAWHLEPAARLPRHPETLWPGSTRLPAFLLLLTQAELVVVEEGDGRRHGPYAATWTYLPLDQLTERTVEPAAPGDRVAVRLRLADGATTECLAPAGSAAALDAFLKRTRELAPPSAVA